MGFLDRFRAPHRRLGPDAPDPPAPPQPPRGAFDALRELALGGADLTAQRPLLIDGLIAHGLSVEAIPEIMERARDGVVLLERGDETRRSRIGGPALLPPATDWPLDRDGEALTFIACLDLDELPELAPLPASGTLLFYWSERFADWDRMDFRVATRVFHVPEAESRTARVPEGVPSHRAVPLTGVRMPVLGELESIAAAEADGDPLYSAADDLMQLYDHQLLGSSRDIQGPVLDEIGSWFDEGYEESRADFSSTELAGEGWLLLAQIESTGDLMFGDAGALYFVIPQIDLEAGRFDRVIGIMQCA